jgi:mono/diheme cytochrome c family protein
MKRWNLILLLLVLAAGLAIGAGVSMLHNGLSARATPTAMEAMLARNARHLAIPANARNEHNPVTPSDQNLQEAMAHFADHCAPCHGNDGSGDTLYGKGLYPKPPDLRLAETQKLSDGELFWIIENGIRFTGMPAFGGSHGSQDDWKLALFIRHSPQLTMEERVEMERDNPKEPREHEKDQEEQEFLGGAPVQKKARIGASSLVRVGALSTLPIRKRTIACLRSSAREKLLNSSRQL